MTTKKKLANPLTKDMQKFLAQNPLCGAGMSFAQIQHADDHGLAGPHSGGLVVLSGDITEGTSEVTARVKMHDSWGPEYEVVLHAYDPDYDEEFGFDADPVESVTAYANPREAADAFFALLSIEMESA